MRALRLAALLLAAGPAAADVTSFRTPSDNIHCIAVSGEGAPFVDCEILVREGPDPPRPAGCDLDWGSRYALGASGPGQPACAGDTVRSPTAPVLGYGGALTFDGITCRSGEAGLECVNGAGHGFFLSRTERRAW